MLNAPQSVIDALNSRAFSFANLITVNLGDAYDTGSDLVLYLTDAGHQVELNGQIYIPDHALLELDGLSRKASTGQDKVDLSFSAADEDVAAAIGARRYVGKKTTIERVLLDEDGRVIGGYAMPVRTAWGVSHDFDGDPDEPKVILTIDGYLGDLDSDNGWYTTEASHQARYPGDRIMRHADDVRSGDSQSQRYSATYDGVVTEARPDAIPVVYGYREVELVPVALLTHRKTHSSYRHYFTCWILAASAGDVEHVDLASLRMGNDLINATIITDSNSGGGWNVALRGPDVTTSIKDDPLLTFWRSRMDARELARLDGMVGRGLTLIFLRNRNRDGYMSQTNFSVPVKGRRLLDPRDGVVRFTRNPALQHWDFLTSTAYGAGHKNLAVNVEDVKALANHFDDLPGNEGGGIDRIEFDVQLDTSEPLADNLDIWMKGARLYASDYFGELRLKAETISPSVMTIHADDCEGPPALTGQPFTERLNRMTYTTEQLVPDLDDPAKQISVKVEASYPPDGDPVYDTWLAEDNGRPQHDTKALEHVCDLHQALYWAMVDARVSRLGDELTINPPPIAWLLEPGDVITYVDPVLVLPVPGWRVVELSEDEGETELVLEPYVAATHVPDPAVVPAPIPPAPLPRDRFLTVPTALALSQTPAGQWQISWTPGAGRVQFYSVLVTRNGAAVLDLPRVADTHVLLQELVAGNYLVTVQPHNSEEEGPEAALAFELALPQPPSLPAGAVQAGNTYVLLYPQLTQLGFDTEFEFAFRGLDPAGVRVIRGRGRSYQMEGLAPATEYHLSVRTVNPLGESAWLDVSATTTRDNTVINDILDLDPDTSLRDTLDQFERDIGLGSWDDLLAALGQFEVTQQSAEQEGALAAIQKAQQTLVEEGKAQTAELEQLLAQTDEGRALIQELQRAVVHDRQALAEQGKILTAAIGDAQAKAEEYTRASVGYWVDDQGQIVQPGDPAGVAFVPGPLTEEVKNLSILTGDGQSASISQLMQVFQKLNGDLVARGSLATNVNGQVNGLVHSNDGTTRTLDFITQMMRVGDLDGTGTFVPTLYFDTGQGVMVFHGQMVLPDGKTLASAADVANGGGGFVLTLRGGEFPADATATADFEQHVGRPPQRYDRLTYVAVDGSNASTKIFNGSAWEATVAWFNGNQVVDGTILGRAIKANEEIIAPKMIGGQLQLIGSGYMKIQSSTAFGPDALVEWYGPRLLDANGRPRWAELKKANAITYLTDDGAAYFGGTLSAGVYHNAVETTVKTLYNVGGIPVHLGPFSTRGRSKTVVVSFAYSASSSRSEHPGSLTTKHLTYQLQRRTASSNWVTLKSETVQWQVGVAWDSEFNHYWIDEMARHSTTVTDTDPSTEDFEYRVQVTSHDRFHTSTHVSTQELSIVSTEQ